MPRTSCLYGKWVEDVCAGQFGVFVYLVLRCLGCCTWFSCCAANVRLSIGLSVWYCYVPGHWLSSGPWQESGPMAFVVIPHQVDYYYYYNTRLTAS